MPFVLTCRRCRAQFQADATKVGRQIGCPDGCESSTVTGSEPFAATIPTATAPPPRRPRAAAQAAPQRSDPPPPRRTAPVICSVCRRGELQRRKIHRLSGPAVVIGYIILI